MENGYSIIKLVIRKSRTLFVGVMLVVFGSNSLFAQSVSSVYPTQNTIITDISSNIQITFSEDMDPTTLTTGTILVYGSLSKYHEGILTYNSGTFTATYNPDSAFLIGETVTVTITKGVKNTSETVLTNAFTWSFSVGAPSTGNFSAETPITSASSPTAVVLSDVNLDGLLDIVEMRYSSRRILVYINLGNRTFDTPTEEYVTGANPYRLIVEDLNADGYPDLAYTNYGDGNFSIRLNTGEGVFNAASDYTVGDNPAELVAGDLDGDGDLDLICLNAGSNNMTVFKNNGSGSFSNSGSFGLNGSSNRLGIADLDGDGDLDAMVTSWNPGTLAILLNNGNGTFAARVDYNTLGINPRGVSPIDIDLDGDLDLIVANSGNNSLSIFTNSDGEFTLGSEIAVGDYPLSTLVVDIDGDGDFDIISVNANSSNLSVLKNDGSGDFSDKTDYATGSLAASAAIGDIDNDMDLDIVTANQVGNSLSIFKGLGEDPAISSVYPVQNALSVETNSDIEVVFTAPVTSESLNGSTIKVTGSFRGNYSATFSYQPGSKKLIINPNQNFYHGEIISVSITSLVKNSDNVYLAEPFVWVFTVKSETVLSYSPKVEYDVTGSNPYFVQAADVDGDGYLDLVTANWVSKDVSVLINNSDGTFGSETKYDIGGKPNNFIAADLDNDGFLDFISLNTDSFDVSILMNNGSGTLAEKVKYSIGYEGLWTITAADVNGDGYIDLITGNSYYNSLSVLLNMGDGTFAEKVDYDALNNTSNINYADVDNDGDLDLITVNYFEESGTVFLNAGNGTFNAGTDFAIGLKVGFLVSGDVDNDGYSDIITVSYGDSLISVLLNDGTGSFASQVNYHSGGAWNVEVADIDGDGDLDILTRNYPADKFTILRNNGNGTFASKEDYTTANTPAWIHVADLDNDGDLDIIIANDESNSISVFKAETLAAGTNESSGEFANAEYNTPTTLTGNVAVTGTLTVGAQISTGGNAINLGTTGNLAGETPSNYIQGTVQATRTISSSQSNIGGLGISIDPQSNNLGSTVIKRETGAAEHESAIKQVWTITPTSQPSGPVTVTLSWPSTNDNGVNLADLVVFKSGDNGDSWDVVSATINTDTDPRTATFTITSFSLFTLGESASLPVELSSFTVAKIGGEVVLNWSTTTETNNYGFEVESKTGQSWNKIGFVAGNGTTTEAKSYSFVDHSVSSGTVSYRLKQIDFDGKYAFSSVQTLELTPETFELLGNYPNPFNPSTMINFQLPQNSKVTITVFDVLGRQINVLVNEEKPAGIHQVQFNATGISSGLYFYQVKAGNEVRTGRMLLSK